MAKSIVSFSFPKSAQWCADFLNGFPVGVYRTTLEGKLIFCNRAFAQLFGFGSAEELRDFPVVKLYRNKKDRGRLVQTIIENGGVTDFPLPFKRRDGKSVWCAVTVRPVFDDDGLVVLLDGLVRDIDGASAPGVDSVRLDRLADELDDLVMLLDAKGNLIDVNRAASRLFGFAKEELIGKPLFELIVPRQRALFPLVLSDVLKAGREEGVLTILNREGLEYHIEFQTLLVKRRGRIDHVKAIARNVTERVNHQKEQLVRERLQGVMEMAGGVAHRLNQPLTIINNTLEELLSEFKPGDRHYKKISKIHAQMNKINDIAKKIGGVKKYEAMDYVAGIRIVDLDKASMKDLPDLSIAPLGEE